MSQSIDTGVERTPPTVSAMRSFKEKLLQGHKVKASQFGIELPVMKIQDDVAYGPDDESDSTDNSEEDTGVTDVYQDPDEIGPMEGTTSYTTPYIGKAAMKRDPVQMLADYLEQTPAKEEVRIVGPFGRLGFKALNVSITEFGVAFIIKRDAIQFEPNINTELTIQYRGQDYSVIYAGGFFTFPKIPFTFVSFLRIQTE